METENQIQDNHHQNQEQEQYSDIEELLQYVINESFDTEQPLPYAPHRLTVTPIVVPNEVSTTRLFCCACMEYYPEHEMHVFKNCPHGLCKHYCAAMYTSPFCPECKCSLIDENEEENDLFINIDNSLLEQERNIHNIVNSILTHIMNQTEQTKTCMCT